MSLPCDSQVIVCALPGNQDSHDKEANAEAMVGGTFEKASQST